MILETIPPLMDSLQIVWMLSCHYNTNERMVSLMERIAWQLCERVDQVIDVHKLFKYVWIYLHFFIGGSDCRYKYVIQNPLSK